MRIKGVVEVEDIRLHVDIEAPDDGKDIYVTNIHPNCLVVPKERWPVGYLGLSAEALTELGRCQIKHLGQLTNGSWSLAQNSLSEATSREIAFALEELKKSALIFEPASPEEIAREVAGFPIPEVGLTKKVKSVEKSEPTGLTQLSLNTPLKDLPDIPQRLREAILVVHQVRTLGELLAMSKPRIVMTPTVTANDMKRLEAELGRLGYVLGSLPSTVANPENNEAEEVSHDNTT